MEQYALCSPSIFHEASDLRDKAGVDVAAIPTRTFEVFGMHAMCERDKVGRAEIISENPLH